MKNLQTKISNLMSQRKMSFADIEKETGLNRNTVYSIVSGASKNPGVNALQLIAKALGVSLATILIEEEDIQPNPLSHNQLKAFSEATTATINTIIEKNLTLPIDKLILIIKEIYQYSIKADPPNIDPRFIDWLLEHKYNN